MQLRVEDDGSGLEDGRAEQALVRGQRLDETVSCVERIKRLSGGGEILRSLQPLRQSANLRGKFGE